MKVLHYRHQIDALGTVLFVSFDEPEQLRRTLLRGLELPYALLVDRDRAAYRAWGSNGGPSSASGATRVSGCATPVRSRVASDSLGGGDTLQLGDDFVVDPDGTVSYRGRRSATTGRPSPSSCARSSGPPGRAALRESDATARASKEA